MNRLYMLLNGDGSDGRSALRRAGSPGEGPNRHRRQQYAPRDRQERTASKVATGVDRIKGRDGDDRLKGDRGDDASRATVATTTSGVA